MKNTFKQSLKELDKLCRHYNLTECYSIEGILNIVNAIKESFQNCYGCEEAFLKCGNKNEFEHYTSLKKKYEEMSNTDINFDSIGDQLNDILADWSQYIDDYGIKVNWYDDKVELTDTINDDILCTLKRI